jgi:hypothetical protein
MKVKYLMENKNFAEAICSDSDIVAGNEMAVRAGKHATAGDRSAVWAYDDGTAGHDSAVRALENGTAGNDSAVRAYDDGTAGDRSSVWAHDNGKAGRISAVRARLKATGGEYCVLMGREVEGGHGSIGVVLDQNGRVKKYVRFVRKGEPIADIETVFVD